MPLAWACNLPSEHGNGSTGKSNRLLSLQPSKRNSLSASAATSKIASCASSATTNYVPISAPCAKKSPPAATSVSPVKPATATATEPGPRPSASTPPAPETKSVPWSANPSQPIQAYSHSSLLNLQIHSNLSHPRFPKIHNVPFEETIARGKPLVKKNQRRIDSLRNVIKRPISVT